ncbi:MAG: EAL domain-containing protein, partial [Sphingomonas sp.]|nr:EAL domain-containing protein [Sphingomonas sp.]
MARWRARAGSSCATGSRRPRECGSCRQPRRPCPRSSLSISSAAATIGAAGDGSRAFAGMRRSPPGRRSLRARTRSSRRSTAIGRRFERPARAIIRPHSTTRSPTPTRSASSSAAGTATGTACSRPARPGSSLPIFGSSEPRILKLLTETNFPPARLEVEITETSLLEDRELALSTIQSLKNTGISISLDDFGTGYSSLSQLRSMPFDRIKIDRSFVETL